MLEKPLCWSQKSPSFEGEVPALPLALRQLREGYVLGKDQTWGLPRERAIGTADIGFPAPAFIALYRPNPHPGYSEPYGPGMSWDGR